MVFHEAEYLRALTPDCELQLAKLLNHYSSSTTKARLEAACEDCSALSESDVKITAHAAHTALLA